MAESIQEQQLVALMFTDIVDSVAMQSRHGTASYTRFIQRHDEIFKACLSGAASKKILNETGDGFLVSFGTATEAVKAALRLQNAMHGEVVEGEALRVSIGSHLGEVTQMDEQVSGETAEVPIRVGRDLSDWHIEATTRQATSLPARKDSRSLGKAATARPNAKVPASPST